MFEMVVTVVLLARERDEQEVTQSVQSSVQGTPASSPVGKPLVKIRVTGELKKASKEAKEAKEQSELKFASTNVILKERLERLVEKLDQKGVRLDYIKTAGSLLNSLRQRKKGKRDNEELRSLLGGNSRQIELEKDYEVPISGHMDMAKFEGLLYGVRYRDWLDIILFSTHCSIVEQKFEEAYRAIFSAYSIPVINSDPRLRQELGLVMIATAYMAKDHDRISAYLRSYCHVIDISIIGLRMMSFFLCESPKAIAAFATSANQKFFSRQLTKFSRDKNVSRIQLAHFHAIHGHVSFCAKSYTIAISNYLTARAIVPEDPIINLCLGIAYLHRATLKTEIRSFNFVKVHLWLMTGPVVSYGLL
jgi:hypothetical protein